MVMQIGRKGLFYRGESVRGKYCVVRTNFEMNQRQRENEKHED